MGRCECRTARAIREAWLRWQEIAGTDIRAEELSVSERANRNLRADVALFLNVLCDEDKQPVFTPDDEAEVRAIYGPVHSRLLKQVLDLIASRDDAREKSPPPALNS